MPSIARSMQFSLVALTFGATLVAASCESFNPAECDDDTDCGAARVCAAGQCVACAGSADCGADQFCCNGECLAGTEVDRHCGCGPSTGGNPGTDCTLVEPAGLCLAGGVTANVDSVGQGSCGCGCSAAEGGPVCGAPAEPGLPAVCSCVENGDCRIPSVDASGRPHRSTDTCNPSDKCVCFATSAPSTSCGPDGEAPDCSATSGCINLASSASDCGVGGHSCLDPAHSLASGGSCVEGGCTCDEGPDCLAAGLNVNACQFVLTVARCVCNGYTRAGTPAACPMELECGDEGCILEGVSYSTEEALRASFGLP